MSRRLYLRQFIMMCFIKPVCRTVRAAGKTCYDTDRINKNEDKQTIIYPHMAYIQVLIVFCGEPRLF